MIKYFFQFLELMFRGMMVLISLFMLLCLNVLTIPIFIVLWLCCKLFRQQTPHWRRYGLMFYPSWSYAKERTFLDDEIRLKRKTDKKIKKHPPVRAWEEMFFW